MVIKREMSLVSVVFEEFSGRGGGEVEKETPIINVCEGERMIETEGKVCVFQSASLPLALSFLYILFMSPTYMSPCLHVHA